jgi:hypothetical protein
MHQSYVNFDAGIQISTNGLNLRMGYGDPNWARLANYNVVTKHVVQLDSSGRSKKRQRTTFRRPHRIVLTNPITATALAVVALVILLKMESNRLLFSFGEIFSRGNWMIALIWGENLQQFTAEEL